MRESDKDSLILEPPYTQTSLALLFSPVLTLTLNSTLLSSPIRLHLRPPILYRHISSPLTPFMISNTEHPPL